MYQFAAHGRSGQSSQSLSLVTLLRRNSNFLDLIHRHGRRPSQSLDESLRADTLLDMLFDLLQDFSSKYYHRCRAIAYFSVLGAGYVGEDSGGRVDYIEQLSTDASKAAL